MAQCNFCYYRFTNFLWLRSQCPHCKHPLNADPLASHRVVHPAPKLLILPELKSKLDKSGGGD